MAGKKGHRLRTIAYTKTFKNDYQRMAAAGRYDMALVSTVGGLLIAHTPQQMLKEQWRDSRFGSSIPLTMFTHGLRRWPAHPRVNQ